ncbi:MAG: GxxExxY protein [Candidatus Doudnabacteria bacterium]|nr:GxxExxY protein [Candidatus Doudnabacteria bacterium]
MNTDNTDNTDVGKHGLLYEDLTFAINGILFSVHNELGQYAREKQYGDVLERICKEKNIAYDREKVIGNSGNTLDFVIANKVILELKAKRIVTKEDYYQTQRYLQETGLRLAILVNFRDKVLRPKRIVKIDNWKN